MNVLSRRGFTLVELLVVVMLGGFIVLATYQVLITNSRTYAVNNARIQGQQSLRAGLDILFGELREVSTPQGDLIAMGADSVTFRAQRTIGLVCEVDYTVSPPELRAMQIDNVGFQAGDSVMVFHDNNPNRASDDVWYGATVQSVGTGVLCDTNTAQDLRIPALSGYASAASPDSVRVGALVRAFDTYTYGLYTIDGDPYLGRRLAGATDPDPLVGPLLPNQGVTFQYLDTLGATAAVPADVAQIQVVLRYQSAVRNSEGDFVADSIVARVYPRN